MSNDFISIAVIIGLLLGLLVLRTIWYYHRRKHRGIHFGPAAAGWAESRFPLELRPVAAFVADLLRDQLGVGFAQLEPQTRFIEDLDMTDLEPAEVVMALEEELGIKIPDDDVQHIYTISELVHYLANRLPASTDAQPTQKGLQTSA